jgi:sulfide:quinone oxidoreductase
MRIKRYYYSETERLTTAAQNISVMDTGDGAGFVYRTGHSEMFIPLPIVGHWLKKAWGYYYKLSKMKYIPRIPGM